MLLVWLSNACTADPDSDSSGDECRAQDVPSEYDVRIATDPDPAILAEFRKRAETAWGILAAHLTGREFVAAPRLTIADLSLCGYLFWEDEIGIDWRASHPAIADWLGRIRSQPRWVAPYALMPGHPRPGRS